MQGKHKNINLKIWRVCEGGRISDSLTRQLSADKDPTTVSFKYGAGARLHPCRGWSGGCRTTLQITPKQTILEFLLEKRESSGNPGYSYPNLRGNILSRTTVANLLKCSSHSDDASRLLKEYTFHDRMNTGS